MSPDLINEIITLKTVSRLSPVEIARRCSVEIADVADVLIDAGLLNITSAAKPLWLNSADRHQERRDRHFAPAPPAIGDENPDLKHCLRVVRALGGRGFPYLALEGAH